MAYKVAVAWEIVDFGVEHAQCHQGLGTAHTKYTHSFLGAGNDAEDALEDALEQAAGAGWNVDLITYVPPEGPSVSGEGEDSELYYYVGVRLRAYTPSLDGREMEAVSKAVLELARLRHDIHNLVLGQELRGEDNKAQLLLKRGRRRRLERFFGAVGVELYNDPFWKV